MSNDISQAVSPSLSDMTLSTQSPRSARLIYAYYYRCAVVCQNLKCDLLTKVDVFSPKVLVIEVHCELVIPLTC